MDKQASQDRSGDLANKTPKDDSYLKIHFGLNYPHINLDIDLELSSKQISMAIGRAVMSVGKQLILQLLLGSMVVKTPHPNYPQLPVPPESTEQSQ
jgi:hypothetical protein